MELLECEVEVDVASAKYPSYFFHPNHHIFYDDGFASEPRVSIQEANQTE